MSDVIDWSKAPEGATHYYHNGTGRGVCSHWIRACGKGRYWIGMLRFSKLWQEDTSPVDLRHAIALPNPTPWSGEGLPPVGAVCEVRCIGGGWGAATIKYISPTQCVWLWVSDNEDQAEFAREPWNMEFRPIRAPEQIAADERNDAIAAIVAQSLGRCDSVGAAYIYDAGYRRKP